MDKELIKNTIIRIIEESQSINLCEDMLNQDISLLKNRLIKFLEII